MCDTEVLLNLLYDIPKYLMNPHFEVSVCVSTTLVVQHALKRHPLTFYNNNIHITDTQLPQSFPKLKLATIYNDSESPSGERTRNVPRSDPAPDNYYMSCPNNSSNSLSQLISATIAAFHLIIILLNITSSLLN